MSILTSGGGHAVVNVLVACKRLLGYDLLIRIDVIRALEGVMITPAGDVKLGVGKEARAVSMNWISMPLLTIMRGYGLPGRNGP